MRKTLLIGLVTLAIALSAIAVAYPALIPTTSHGENVKDYTSLVDNLRKAGAIIDLSGDVSHPFFSVEGWVIKVNGEAVQVFEYPDSGSADSEARLVSADGGTVGTTMIHWVDSPHFYKAGRLIVLYVGSDPAIMSLLESVLGPQFAGR